MALIEIPIDPAQPDHQFYLELEKVVYLFRFMLNSRSGRITMNIYTEDGTLIVGGIPLVVNTALIGRFKLEDLPPGEIWVLDLTGAGAEPTQESFGKTHSLVYEESEGAS